jgi:hypothetical protein
MFDDGNHQDGLSNDGQYGGQIPAFPNGVFVRYYIESIANNSAGTVNYMPEGAEHDVFIYQVNLMNSVYEQIVINEIMASNTKTVSDQDGEFDDWIELYNKSNQPVDISNWILTDNNTNLDKYRFPLGTVILPDSYLIVWADEDGKQSGYHANFKLSATGEDLILLDSSALEVDRVIFGQQESDKGYARNPNGTGDFVIQTATFNNNNNLSTGTVSSVKDEIQLFPNPAKEKIYIVVQNLIVPDYKLFDCYGRIIVTGILNKFTTIDVSSLKAGIYYIQVNSQTKKIIIN